MDRLFGLTSALSLPSGRRSVIWTLVTFAGVASTPGSISSGMPNAAISAGAWSLYAGKKPKVGGSAQVMPRTSRK